PSFYRGLLRPLLLSVLRGGIAWVWDLGHDFFRATVESDTHPRTLLVSRYCASDCTSLEDWRLHTPHESLLFLAMLLRFVLRLPRGDGSFLLLAMLRRVVLLLALPHRKSDGGDLAGDRQLREVRLRARRDEPLVVLMQGVAGEMRDDGHRCALENMLQHMIVI